MLVARHEDVGLMAIADLLQVLVERFGRHNPLGDLDNARIYAAVSS